HRPSADVGAAVRPAPVPGVLDARALDPRARGPPRPGPGVVGGHAGRAVRPVHQLVLRVLTRSAANGRSDRLRRRRPGLMMPLQGWSLRADGIRMAIRVVIADDHSLVRQGLRRYLEMAGDIDVIGEASTGTDVLRMIDNGSGEPDVVLLDIRMPEMDGLETARRIRVRHPAIGIIMLTAYDDRQFVVEAVRAGDRCYVLKAR